MIAFAAYNTERNSIKLYSILIMDFTEHTISSKQIFKGHIVNLKVDTVTLSDGNISTRELIEHPGSVGILAIDENNQVFLVKQFRKPFEKTVTEIPAGKLKYGENPLIAAKRELEEEIGYRADNIHPLGHFYSSPGFCNETIYLYLATNLVPVGQKLDNDEFLEIIKMDFNTLYKNILSGKFHDGKTAIAVLLAKQNLN